MTQYAPRAGLSPTRIDYMKFFHAEAAALAGCDRSRMQSRETYQHRLSTMRFNCRGNPCGRLILRLMTNMPE